MKKIDKPTLVRVSEQLAARDWDKRALEDLVAPAHGVITGFQDLLDELHALQKSDLGETPPAGSLMEVTSKK